MQDQQENPDKKDKEKGKPNPQQGNPGPLSRSPLLWLFPLFLLIYFWLTAQAASDIREISYTRFKSLLSENIIESVVIEGNNIQGDLKKTIQVKVPQSGVDFENLWNQWASSKQEATGTSNENRQESAASRQSKKSSESESTETIEIETFTTYKPPMEDPDLLKTLEKKGIEVQARPAETWWDNFLVNLLPWILILGIFLWASRKIQQSMMQGGGGGPGGIFGFGQSKAKKFNKEQSTVRFDDVAGLENPKKDLQEIVGYLSEPEKYQQMGAKVPRGILLMGPPGTGKTLMAKAVAGEAGVPFYSISGSEFIEMFVGVGASRVRGMFEDAKKEAPSIIFIDELDSIGRERGAGVGGGHDEREQTLNQILSEMDGFEQNESVVVLAATNRPDVLDKALMRPGRFDRKVTLDIPHREARRQVLEVHTKQTKLAQDIDLDVIARRTAGFSGADLENLVNEATLMAVRAGKKAVDMEALDQARDRIVLGAERKHLMSDEERQLIAYHESGHALMAYLADHADPLEKVTIIPRGQALGATEQIPEEEKKNLQEDYLKDRIIVMLGGRTAERIIYHQFSSGAQNDLQQATGLARRMVSQWGMSEKLGPVAYRQRGDSVFLGQEMAQDKEYSEHTGRLIDEEIYRVISEIENRAVERMKANSGKLKALASELMDQETIDADRIREIFANN